MIDELASSFPSFSVFSENDLKKTGEALELAGLESKASQYLSFSLSVSLSVFLLFFLFLLPTFEILLALAFSLIAFATIYLFLLKLPRILAKRRAQAIEADLSIALRSVSTELGMGVAFEKALMHNAKSNYSVAPEFGKAVQLVEKGGASVPEALRLIAVNIDSLLFKRAVQQLIGAYEHGSKGDGLRHLADELIEIQKAGTREYNARIAFLGLLFVAVSCIVPSLFLAYVIVGSSFLYSSFSPQDIWLTYVFGFPACGGLVLLVIYERTPKALGTRKEGIASKKQMALADNILKTMGVDASFSRVLSYLLIFSTACSLAILALSFILNYEPWVSLLPFAIPVLSYFLMIRKIEARAREIELRLPDALLQASSFPKGTPIDKVIKSIADSGYGPLSLEFATAQRQIKSGVDVPSALRSVSEENDSVLLSRACELLSQAYSAGGDMHKAMKETAEDMFSIFSIVRERESTLALQKYTLMFGGALLVPLVMGSITNMVSKLGTGGIELISSTTPAERAMLLGASVGAAQAYLVIYSLLASLFIAQLGGSWRNFALYFLMMAPLSLISYNVAMGAKLFG